MSDQPFYSDENNKRSAWIYIAGLAFVALLIFGAFKIFSSKDSSDEILIRPIAAPDSTLNNNNYTANPNARTNGEAAIAYICDTIMHIKYEKIDNGRGGYKKGKLLERNSTECGYNPYPLKGTLATGYICDVSTHTKFTKVNDGKGGFEQGTAVLEKNSEDCGFVAVKTVVPPPVAKAEVKQPVVTRKQETPQPVVIKPAEIKPVAIKPPAIKPADTKTPTAKELSAKAVCVKGTPSGKPYCGRGANAGKLMQKKCNGKGGFFEDVIDPCTTECECGDISPREKLVPVIKN